MSAVLEDGLADGISKDGGGRGNGVRDGVDDLRDGTEGFLDGVGEDI